MMIHLSVLRKSKMMNMLESIEYTWRGDHPIHTSIIGSIPSNSQVMVSIPDLIPDNYATETLAELTCR